MDFTCKRRYFFVLCFITYLFSGTFYPVSGYNSRFLSEETEKSEEDSGTGEYVDDTDQNNPISGYHRTFVSEGMKNSEENPDTGEFVDEFKNGDGFQRTSDSDAEDISGDLNDALVKDLDDELQNYFESCDIPFDELEKLDYCNLADNDEIAEFFGLTCDKDSNSADASDGDSLHNSEGQKWPNGIVNYIFDKSLTKNDIKAFNIAITEYHSKTCIRFVKVKEILQEMDAGYTRIMVNPKVCGRGSVCKKSSNNFASFGKGCRDSSTMIHELGHNLCRKHEHQRDDRDDYLHMDYTSSKRCRKTQNNHNFTPVPKGYHHPMFYDYASAMHYDCGGCIKSTSTVKSCGKSQQPGLSVLDVDSINELYNCRGCHSHRWVTPQRASRLIRENSANFGCRGSGKTYIYPCRASVGAKGKQVALGMYNVNEKSCVLANGNQVVKEKRKFQVLYIPQNVEKVGYVLVPNQNVVSVTQALAGGHQLNPYKRQYIAYMIDRNGVGSIGKTVWDDNLKSFGSAEMVIRNKVKRTNLFYVLLCVEYSKTAIRQRVPMYERDIYDNVYTNDVSHDYDYDYGQNIQEDMFNEKSGNFLSRDLDSGHTEENPDDNMTGEYDY